LEIAQLLFTSSQVLHSGYYLQCLGSLYHHQWSDRTSSERWNERSHLSQCYSEDMFPWRQWGMGLPRWFGG